MSQRTDRYRQRRPRIYRKISDLQWAEWWQGRPPHKRSTRVQGSRARGRAYENALGRHLLLAFPQSIVISHPWIRFEDTGGLGYAQPDFVVLESLGSEDARTWIFEAKLTHIPESYQQLAQLYSPLVQAVWPSETQVLIETFRWASTDFNCPKPLVSSPRDALAEDSKVCYWHWLD